MLPPRLLNSHKGNFGWLAVVGSDAGMSGAVRMCGEAALRSGAGSVSRDVMSGRPGVGRVRPAGMTRLAFGSNLSRSRHVTASIQAMSARRSATAATFAASLELAKAGKIELRQGETFAPIQIRRRGDGDG
mgnify:CR=1 FL=1